jgi:hypothetical protein
MKELTLSFDAPLPPGLGRSPLPRGTPAEVPFFFIGLNSILNLSKCTNLINEEMKDRMISFICFSMGKKRRD